MKEVILLKCGELSLKGLNRRNFESVLIRNCRRRLEKLGLMTEHGRKVLPDLDTDGFEIAADMLERLQADETVWRNFQALPPLYRRIRIDNIQRVRNNAALYENRLSKFIDCTRRNVLYGDWHDHEKLLSY